MPKLTIDGKKIEVEPGTPVIDAAMELGIAIPRYCYHPGLPVAGSCRMCMVEIENAPKLQIACYTPAADDMVVRTDTIHVKRARQAMLEFLLINHPLDCPVCDQAGECDLQNFYMAHGLHPGSNLEAKIVKSKKAFPIGEHILLDQERCVLCSRCTRFTEHVTGSGELGIYERGHHSVVDLAPGKRLENNYQGNLADICPVGALLDRDFRFKLRVWYLGARDSICPGCSRGCNISVQFNASGRSHHADGERVMRLKPRPNPDVNGYWMCDLGRYAYPALDSPDRIRFATVPNGAGPETVDVKVALDRAAEAIRVVLDEHGPDALAVVASPQMTNEDLYLVDHLFRKGLGVETLVWKVLPREKPEGDDLLLRADRAPNGRGAAVLGLGRDAADPDETFEGKRAAIVFHHDLALRPAWKVRLKKLDTIVFVGPHEHATSRMATIVIPAAMYAEKEGTFTNFEGRVQRIRRAIDPLGDARPETEILQGLAARLEVEIPGGSPQEVFRALAGDVQRFRKMTYETIGSQGQPVKKA